jgi:hypothetical protein
MMSAVMQLCLHEAMKLSVDPIRHMLRECHRAALQLAASEQWDIDWEDNYLKAELPYGELPPEGVVLTIRIKPEEQ